MLFETGIRALPQVLPCVVRATGLHYLPNPFFKNIDLHSHSWRRSSDGRSAFAHAHR